MRCRGVIRCISPPKTPSSRYDGPSWISSGRVRQEFRPSSTRVTYEHRLIDDMVAAPGNGRRRVRFAKLRRRRSRTLWRRALARRLMTSVLGRRQGRGSGGRARHRDAPLPRTSEGKGFTNSSRVCSDARLRPSRQAHNNAALKFTTLKKSRHCSGLHDQVYAAGRLRWLSTTAPGQGGCKPEEGDGRTRLRARPVPSAAGVHEERYGWPGCPRQDPGFWCLLAFFHRRDFASPRLPACLHDSTTSLIRSAMRDRGISACVGASSPSRLVRVTASRSRSGESGATAPPHRRIGRHRAGCAPFCP